MNKFKVPDYWFWKNFFNRKEILDLNKLINKHKLTEQVVKFIGFFIKILKIK